VLLLSLHLARRTDATGRHKIEKAPNQRGKFFK
jgi:hypothetical protein